MITHNKAITFLGGGDHFKQKTCTNTFIQLECLDKANNLGRPGNEAYQKSFGRLRTSTLFDTDNSGTGKRPCWSLCWVWLGLHQYRPSLLPESILLRTSLSNTKILFSQSILSKVSGEVLQKLSPFPHQ